MFTTPQKRGGASTLFGSPTIILPATKGLFIDGIWNCNCAPRLPATKFQVKKETRNQGRYFYTCQIAKDDGGCGFFLWNEDAMTREGKAVLGNSRTEGEAEVRKTPDARSAARMSPSKAVGYGNGNDRTPTAGRGNGMKATQVNLDTSESEGDDEFGSWPLSPTTQKKVVESTDTQKTSTTLSPETPRKASKMTPFTTPGSKRKRDFRYDISDDDHDPIANVDGLPTPITEGGMTGRRVISFSEYGNDDTDIFSTPSSLRTPSQSYSFGMRSPSNTPTPFANHHHQPRSSSPTPFSDTSPMSHFHALQSPFLSRQEEATNNVMQINASSYDITTDVLALLQDQDVSIDEETKGKLKSLLGRHAMRVSGIAKGRDITRVALKGKDVRIAELGGRISGLEAEREVDKRIIAGLKEELGSGGGVGRKGKGRAWV